MKRRERKYVLILVAIFVAFVAFEYLRPRPIDWSISLSSEDKIPFGTYALDELIPDIFPEGGLEKRRSSIAELERDSSYRADNLLIIAERFFPDSLEINLIITQAVSGKNVFIAAENVSQTLLDTLDLSTADLYTGQSLFFRNLLDHGDTVELQFEGHVDRYPFALRAVPSYIELYDPLTSTILARNHYEDPVLVMVQMGKGAIYLCTTPLIFSNFYLTNSEQRHYAERLLNFLPYAPTLWTEYYQVGRLESTSPLRFVLRDPALRWAYYLTTLGLLTFVLFEAKRKQRVIPIVKPPENSSLEFATIVGRLYLRKGDHANLARKKLNYFKEHIREKYYLNIHFEEQDVERLSEKTNQPEEVIRALFQLANQIEQANTVTVDQLLALNGYLDNFETETA